MVPYKIDEKLMLIYFSIHSKNKKPPFEGGFFSFVGNYLSLYKEQYDGQ